MESLYLLIPMSLVISLLAGLIFWWAATRGRQFDQMDLAARSIIFDDDSTPLMPTYKPRPPTYFKKATGQACNDESFPPRDHR